MADAQSQPDALALADSVKFAIQHRDEEIERLTARNEKLEAVYEAANGVVINKGAARALAVKILIDVTVQAKP